MKNFLANKNNVAVSAYITDLNPTQITTNGALTIIDNSDPNQHIQGLVPNSYNIFLDNLFLASGYGFSSYNHFNKATYLINTYNNVVSYIENEINDLRNNTFNIEFSYTTSENKIDKVYNSYGWLKEYKEIKVERTNSNSYTISLNTVNTPYISNVKLEIIGGKDINGENINNSTDLIYNYFNINNSAEVKLSFIKNNILEKSKFGDTAPTIYFNDEVIDFSDNLVQDDNNLIYIIRNFEAPLTNQTKDLTFVCKHGEDIIYSYTFVDAIKWRYTILPFNTEKVNALTQINLTDVSGFDNHDFSDESFNNSLNTSGNTVLDSIKLFIDNNESNMMYLDDNTEIEYLGIGYKMQSDNEYINYFTHDYVLVKYNSIKMDFYFNGIKNNNWNYIEFNHNNLVYRLYQSPKRYIGKHTWNIRYNYG